MRSILITFVFAFLISCGNSKANKEVSTSQTTSEKATTPVNEAEQGGIVGEWEQQYTCFDKNGNKKLDPEEKNPSNTRVGFDWFRFNADGSCLRDKEVKFKSTYKVQNKGNTKEVVIQNVHGYTIIELTNTELILGAEGAFMVFKKIS